MRKLNTVIILIILLFAAGNNFTYALNWYQVTTVNNDRSGKIKLSYWEDASKLKNVSIYQTLPFTDDKIRQIFNSDNNNVEKISISKTNPETTYVNVEITFKDFQKINTAQGFSKVKTTFYKTADSTVLLYQLEKNEAFAEVSSAIITFELPTKELLRFSGSKIKENIITIGLRPDHIVNGTTLFAVFMNSDENPPPTTQETQSPVTNNVNEKQLEGIEKENSGRVCGLFALELPLILCVGLFLMNIRRKTS